MLGNWGEVAGPSRTDIHVQIKGDTMEDPGALLTVLANKVEEWTGIQYAAQALGTRPSRHSLTPIPNPFGKWDGGIVVVTASSEEAIALASRLNDCCIPGAGGTTRLGVDLRHGYTHLQVSWARDAQGSGGHRRSAGRAARAPRV